MKTLRHYRRAIPQVRFELTLMIYLSKNHSCDPDGTRTHNTLFKGQVRYQLRHETIPKLVSLFQPKLTQLMFMFVLSHHNFTLTLTQDSNLYLPLLGAC